MVWLFGLDQLATELVEKKVATAVVVAAAVRTGGAWRTAIGAAGRLSDAADDRAARADTWFDLASLTKPVTALAAARVARRGTIAWGAELGVLLPELASATASSATLEQLLSHRAGLEAHRRFYRHMMDGRTVDRRESLFEAASSRRAPPPSGSEFEPLYSDLGYLLAGEAIARVARLPLDAVLNDEVIAPLRLAMGSARQIRACDASFDRDVAATECAAWRGGTVRGFVHDENAWFWSGEGASGHAGLFGTATAVLTLGEAVVDCLHDRLPQFLTRDEMWPLVKPRPGGTLRAGFDGKSEQGSSAGTRFGPSTVGHLGFTGTSFWCDVDREMVGVLLTNRVHPSRDNDAIRAVRPFAYDRIAAWAERERGTK
ncbi:MAG: serine hydrolase domain-containing protein [Polyangiaceae bacterium]